MAKGRCEVWLYHERKAIMSNTYHLVDERDEQTIGDWEIALDKLESGTDTNIRVRVLIPDGNGVWAIGDPPMLPGGGVKRGEGLRSAAVREALEETGLRVELHGKCLCAVPQGEMTACYFVGTRSGGKPTSLDHDGHTPINPRIVPLDALTTEQDRAAVAAYLKR